MSVYMVDILTKLFTYLLIAGIYFLLKVFKKENITFSCIAGFFISYIISIVIMPAADIWYYVNQIAIVYPMSVIGEMADYFVLQRIMYELSSIDNRMFYYIDSKYVSLFIYGLFQYYIAGVILGKVFKIRNAWSFPKPIGILKNMFLIMLVMLTALTGVLYFNDRIYGPVEGKRNFMADKTELKLADSAEQDALNKAKKDDKDIGAPKSCDYSIFRYTYCAWFDTDEERRFIFQDGDKTGQSFVVLNKTGEILARYRYPELIAYSSAPRAAIHKSAVDGKKYFAIISVHGMNTSGNLNWWINGGGRTILYVYDATGALVFKFKVPEYCSSICGFEDKILVKGDRYIYRFKENRK